jgi:hypothetical protein
LLDRSWHLRCGLPFLCYNDTKYFNAICTALVRRTRIEGDQFGWWITSSANMFEPGQLYYYCNPSQGAQVPMVGWQHHAVLTNGLGFERPSAAQAPPPVLTYLFDRSGPLPPSARALWDETAAAEASLLGAPPLVQ